MTAWWAGDGACLAVIVVGMTVLAEGAAQVVLGVPVGLGMVFNRQLVPEGPVAS